MAPPYRRLRSSGATRSLSLLLVAVLSAACQAELGTAGAGGSGEFDAGSVGGGTSGGGAGRATGGSSGFDTGGAAGADAGGMAGGSGGSAGHSLTGGAGGADAGGSAGLGGESGSGGAGGSAGSAGGASGGSAGSAGSASGGSGGSAGSSGSGGNGGSGGSGGGVAAGSPVHGLRISQISAWQSVKVTLMDAGAARTPNAPLVQGKAALLRVFVTPTAAWTKRAVVGKLKVGSQSQEVTWTPNGASTNSKLSSSLNFNVPGSWLTLGAKFSVQLVEATSGAYSGTTADSRYPSSGTAALGVKSPGGAFRVKLVPIKINGRLPLLNQARQDAYRDYFLAQYPTATLNLSVRAAWTYNSSVAADGTGWPALLSALQQLRQNDNAGPKTYYYGLLAPAGSSSAYCGGACIAGLSNVVGPNDENYRAAIGLGVFADGSDVGWLETSAHELGHAQGRLHAPCGTTVSVDAAFPFAGGKIGRWGYDKRSKTLLNPSQVLDVMGYCDPRWISDYTYKALFNRMAAVNAQAALVLPPGSLRGPGAFIAYQLTPDGRLELLGRVQQRSNALGEARRVYPVDRSGSLLAPIDGYYTPYGEEELGGSLLVPLGALPASSERLVSDSWLAQP